MYNLLVNVYDGKITNDCTKTHLKEATNVFQSTAASSLLRLFSSQTSQSSVTLHHRDTAGSTPHDSTTRTSTLKHWATVGSDIYTKTPCLQQAPHAENCAGSWERTAHTVLSHKSESLGNRMHKHKSEKNSYVQLHRPRGTGEVLQQYQRTVSLQELITCICTPSPAAESWFIHKLPHINDH